jgi:hypothetical protein
LSVAVKEVIETVRLEEVDGIVKDVTVGGVVSAKVIVTLAGTPFDTFPAASLAYP